MKLVTKFNIRLRGKVNGLANCPGAHVCLVHISPLAYQPEVKTKKTKNVAVGFAIDYMFYNFEEL